MNNLDTRVISFILTKSNQILVKFDNTFFSVVNQLTELNFDFNLFDMHSKILSKMGTIFSCVERQGKSLYFTNYYQ